MLAAVLVILPAVLMVRVGSVSASTGWTATQLVPLPGDTSTRVADGNEAGWAVGTSLDASGNSRPVLWDPNGNPTLLPPVAGTSQPAFDLINDNGVIAGSDLNANTLLIKDGVGTILGAYGGPVGLSDDAGPKVYTGGGQVIDTSTGVVTTLPIPDPVPVGYGVTGVDPMSGLQVGTESFINVDPIPNGSIYTNVAVSYDAQGAHQLVTDWPYSTAGGPTRGGITAIRFYTCPQGGCVTAGLLYHGIVFPLDYSDQDAAVVDVNTSGLAVGYVENAQGPSGPVLFVYGHVVPMAQLVPVPPGASWDDAIHITNSDAIFANASRGSIARGFVLRPG